MAGKFIDIAKVLERRLAGEAYALKKFPTEMELAEEFQISRNTVRKVLDLLIERKVLKKSPHKSVEVVTSTTSLSFAFLAPAVYSEMFERLRFFVEHEAQKFGARLKVVDYTDWEDPVVAETLKAFDGVFVIPLSEALPKAVQKLLMTSEIPVVAFEQNLSGLGIPSIISTPDIFVQHILDYLESLGHKNIHCVNTQNSDAVIQARIQQWELWKLVHGTKGQLIHEPVERYGQPLITAHRRMVDFLKTNPSQGTALLCLTEPCAIGALRACWDCGLVVGKDISLATFDSGLSKFMVPALACVDMPDLSAYVGLCLKWMQANNKTWSGPLLLQPMVAKIFAGESVVKS